MSRSSQSLWNNVGTYGTKVFLLLVNEPPFERPQEDGSSEIISSDVLVSDTESTESA